MIPRANIEVAVKVDTSRLSAPDRRDVLYPHWAGITHEYDPYHYDAATWLGATRYAGAEQEAIAYLDKRAGDECEWDEQLWDYEADRGPIGDLELGVGAAVEALNAAGCPTAASCGGHADGSRSPHPWILFACDGARVPPIEEAARAAGCGLENQQAGLLAYAPGVVEMVAFGLQLIARRAEFDALPAPERRDPGAVEEELEDY